jgi:hypothetical protein
MRRHVLGVGRVGCDLGIAQRRRQALGGDRWIIIQVNQVVSDTRVLRLALQDRLENCRAFELIGVALVGRRRRNIERDRVEDLRLIVSGIAAGQGFHRLEIGLNTRLMRGLVIIDIHHR